MTSSKDEKIDADYLFGVREEKKRQTNFLLISTYITFSIQVIHGGAAAGEVCR